MISPKHQVAFQQRLRHHPESLSWPDWSGTAWLTATPYGTGRERGPQNGARERSCRRKACALINVSLWGGFAIRMRRGTFTLHHLHRTPPIDRSQPVLLEQHKILISSANEDKESWRRFYLLLPLPFAMSNNKDADDAGECTSQPAITVGRSLVITKCEVTTNYKIKILFSVLSVQIQRMLRKWRVLPSKESDIFCRWLLASR